MTKLFGCVAATAIGAAIVTATPGFGAGMHGAGRHFVGGFHGPAYYRHHRHFRNSAFVGGPFFYDYAGYGNYCWQQVWTPYGWQWVDACSGYYGYGY
jgi:hypothetical protein